MFLMPGSKDGGKGGLITTIQQAFSPILDGVFGKTQGAIIYRGPSAWQALAPGTAGQLLQTNGANANPSWYSPAPHR